MKNFNDVRGVALALVATLAAFRQDDAFRSALEKKAAAVRPSGAEVLFRTIPWTTDLFEGFRLAKHEARPVFLYTVAGDPLDDC